MDSDPDQYPKLGRLFEDISRYIVDLQRSDQVNQVENPSKKRKLDNGHSGVRQINGQWKTASYSTAKEISFTIPQRKKLTLEIGDATAGLRARNPTTGDVDFATTWEDIEHVTCLPVPEKAQAQYNFCVFPRYADGLTVSSEETPVPDQLLWTVSNAAPKPGICSDDLKISPDESFKSVMVRLLNERLRHKAGRKCCVIEPDESEFSSEATQPSRTGQRAVHVKAFRGSKDGFLFFLSSGIVWGFKKPLIFFAFDAIDSVSYTSVLQRTFNLNVNARANGLDGEPQEIEFSMIDQADFAGIDAYIKRHQLQDASMAEQRRAKKLNINGVKGEKAFENEDDEPGELQRAALEAEQTAKDEDDDEEDDDNFDPGSEGESEGSGTSDEEEEDNGAVADASDGNSG